MNNGLFQRVIRCLLVVASVAIAMPALAEPSYSIVKGADKVPLLVVEDGNPDGPAILFIHGMSQSHLSWRPQFESKLADTHRLIAFDMRGHGGSGKPWRTRDYSSKRKVWAKDVAAVIRSKSLDDVTIVAWSFGGHVAMSYVKKYGTRKLRAVNLSGTLGGLIDFPRTPSPKHDEIMEGSRQRGGLSLADNILGYEAMPQSFTLQPMSDKDIRIAVATGLMNPSYVRRAMTELPLFNSSVVSKLDIPILVSVGEFDEEWPVEAAQTLVEQLPYGQLSLYEASGHFPSMEDPERFNCELSGLTKSAGISCPAELVPVFKSPPSAKQMRERYGQLPSNFVEVDGVQMHFRDEGEGPVLLLLPGHMGSLHMYDAWMPFLKPEYRVVRVDWPPYGLSLPDPKGTYSSPRGAELVIGLMDKLGIEQASLVGTSNGATVAAHIAAYRPDLVDRLALSTFPLGPPPQRVISPNLLEQATLHFSNTEYRPESLFKAILEDIFHDPNKVTTSLVRQYTDINNYPGAYLAQEKYIQNNRAMYSEGGLPILYAKIEAPTLIQWGDGGTVMPAGLAQASADVLTAAPVVVIHYAGAGHMPMIEMPEVTANDLLAFLRGSLDGAARKPLL